MRRADLQFIECKECDWLDGGCRSSGTEAPSIHEGTGTELKTTIGNCVLNQWPFKPVHYVESDLAGRDRLRDCFACNMASSKFSGEVV